MDKRAKSEQFRKRKNNYFQTGYDIGITCDSDLFVMFKRKGKFYTFTNMDEVVLPTQEEIVSRVSKRTISNLTFSKQRNLVISKTAADYATTSRAKRKRSRANKIISPPPNTSDDALSALGIKTPVSPKLDLRSQQAVSQLGRLHCILDSLSNVEFT
jgi:hypothetical protein